LGTALLFGPPLVNRKIAQIAHPRSRRSAVVVVVVVVVAARTSENSYLLSTSVNKGKERKRRETLGSMIL
jgi:hypothetical protein